MRYGKKVEEIKEEINEILDSEELTAEDLSIAIDKISEVVENLSGEEQIQIKKEFDEVFPEGYLDNILADLESK